MSNEHMQDEDDVGSGERSPGAKEIEKEISKIGKDCPNIEKEENGSGRQPSPTPGND